MSLTPFMNARTSGRSAAVTPSTRAPSMVSSTRSTANDRARRGGRSPADARCRGRLLDSPVNTAMAPTVSWSSRETGMCAMRSSKRRRQMLNRACTSGRVRLATSSGGSIRRIRLTAVRRSTPPAACAACSLPIIELPATMRSNELSVTPLASRSTRRLGAGAIRRNGARVRRLHEHQVVGQPSVRGQRAGDKDWQDQLLLTNPFESRDVRGHGVVGCIEAAKT